MLLERVVHDNISVGNALVEDPAFDAESDDGNQTWICVE